jgi:hypothetical protein
MLQQMMTFCGSVNDKPEYNQTHIRSVPNDLVFDLFPALQTLLDQDLRTQTQTPSSQIPQLLLVVCETRSKTTKRESRSQNDGVANSLGGIQSGLDSRNGSRLSGRNIDFYELAESEQPERKTHHLRPVRRDLGPPRLPKFG